MAREIKMVIDGEEYLCYKVSELNNEILANKIEKIKEKYETGNYIIVECLPDHGNPCDWTITNMINTFAKYIVSGKYAKLVHIKHSEVLNSYIDDPNDILIEKTVEICDGKHYPEQESTFTTDFINDYDEEAEYSVVDCYDRFKDLLAKIEKNSVFELWDNKPLYVVEIKAMGNIPKVIIKSERYFRYALEIPIYQIKEENGKFKCSKN